MSPQSLRDVFDRTESVIAGDPARAAVTFVVTGVGSGTVGARVSTRRHTIDADEPPSFGGEGHAPNPIEVTLAGLAACQIVTYRYWAARLDVALDDIEVAVEGDFDLRGLFGLDHLPGLPEHVPAKVGLSGVRIDVRLIGPESAERYEHLREQVDRHCPVLDLLRTPTPVATRLATLDSRPSGGAA